MKTAVQKLKCGGKAKKMKAGGEVPEDPKKLQAAKVVTADMEDREKGFEQFKTEASNNKNYQAYARMNYYNQKLDKALYGEEYDKYAGLKSELEDKGVGRNDRIAYADNMIKEKQFEKYLTKEQIAEILGEEFSDYESTKISFLKNQDNLSGTENPDPWIYGLRNSFATAPNKFKRGIGKESTTSGTITDYGEYHGEMTYNPADGYKTNFSMNDRPKMKSGGKVQKFFDGTLIEETDPALAAAEAKKQGLKNQVLGAGASMAGDAVSNILGDKKSALLGGMDMREDPSKTLKKASGLDTGAAIASGAGKGAAAGAALGPIGAAIGAGAGALLAGVGRLFGAKDRREQEAEATKDWSNSYSAKTAKGMSLTGYKDGGNIKGKGTGKSDEVPMSVPEGSFIVPAENAEIANQIGRTYLGWDKKKTASKESGDVDIKASNGEVIYSPEEVHVLKYHGVNLSELAPNATEKIEDTGKTKGFNDGTAFGPDGKQINKLGGAKLEEEKKKKEEKEDTLTYKQPKDDSDVPDWLKNAPELAGAIQAAGGAYGLLQAGKVPDMKISSTLKKLSGEVRRMAEFGYDPASLNALNNEIESTRRNMSKVVENEGSNSGLDKMARLNTLLSTTIDKKAGLAFADAAEKTRKWADVLKVDSAKAGQEFDINKINIDDYYKNQEMFASLVSAGVSNIVGSRQLKAEQDRLAKMGGTSVFTKE